MSSLLSCAEVSNSIMTTFPTSNILGVRICQCHDEARLLKRSTSFQTCHDIITRMLRSQCVIWICLCPDYCTAVTFVHYLLQIWLTQTTYLQTMIILLGSCLSSVKVMSVFHLTIAVIPVQHQWQIWRNAVNCDNSLRLLLIIGNWYFKYFILLSRDILLLLCFLYSINDKNGRKLPVELQIVCKQFCS